MSFNNTTDIGINNATDIGTNNKTDPTSKLLSLTTGLYFSPLWQPLVQSGLIVIFDFMIINFILIFYRNKLSIISSRFEKKYKEYKTRWHSKLDTFITDKNVRQLVFNYCFIDIKSRKKSKVDSDYGSDDNLNIESDAIITILNTDTDGKLNTSADGKLNSDNDGKLNTKRNNVTNKKENDPIDVYIKRSSYFAIKTSANKLNREEYCQLHFILEKRYKVLFYIRLTSFLITVIALTYRFVNDIINQRTMSDTVIRIMLQFSSTSIYYHLAFFHRYNIFTLNEDNSRPRLEQNYGSHGLSELCFICFARSGSTEVLELRSRSTEVLQISSISKSIYRSIGNCIYIFTYAMIISIFGSIYIFSFLIYGLFSLLSSTFVSFLSFFYFLLFIRTIMNNRDLLHELKCKLRDLIYLEAFLYSWLSNIWFISYAIIFVFYESYGSNSGIWISSVNFDLSLRNGVVDLSDWTHYVFFICSLFLDTFCN